MVSALWCYHVIVWLLVFLFLDVRLTYISTIFKQYNQRRQSHYAISAEQRLLKDVPVPHWPHNEKQRRRNGNVSLMMPKWRLRPSQEWFGIKKLGNMNTHTTIHKILGGTNLYKLMNICDPFVSSSHFIMLTHND